MLTTREFFVWYLRNLSQRDDHPETWHMLNRLLRSMLLFRGSTHLDGPQWLETLALSQEQQ